MVIRSACIIISTMFLSGMVMASHVKADTPCTPFNTDIPVRSTVASAGMLANLRGLDTSIKSQMDKLLVDARGAAAALRAKEQGCAGTCSAPHAAVVFTSSPRVTLKEYSDAATCQKLLQATTAAPIRYDNRRFSTDDAAKGWYNDLTQGNGTDGADLYARCPGMCSPSYSSVVYRTGDEVVVSTSIVCGHARDKGDDQYTLAAAVRWVCS